MSGVAKQQEEQACRKISKASAVDVEKQMQPRVTRRLERKGKLI
jgi:hypothetical protein